MKSEVDEGLESGTTLGDGKLLHVAWNILAQQSTATESSPYEAGTGAGSLLNDN